MTKPEDSHLRIVAVSNRLPISFTVKDQKLKVQESVGGLATGLNAYLNSAKPAPNYVWVGSPNASIPDQLRGDLATIFSERHIRQVSIPKEMAQKFYFGFCNKTLWPLFHYFPSYVKFDKDEWDNYRQVNELFSQTVLEVANPDDLIWIHDYHLMLVPGLLRQRMPNSKIGFFLHTPFPSYEIFRLLPREWGREILKGLLGADLVGFHTYDYTHHFLRCLLRMFGYDSDMGKVFTEDRVVKADTFPMGIDFDKYVSAATSRAVQTTMKKTKRTLGDVRVMLSVDRLDYSKGVVNRLLGFERFLERNESWQGKVVLMLLMTPSRVELEQYRDIKRAIDELVGRINGKFGSVNWTPVLYQSKYVPFNSLVALYRLADVAVVTPLRDGMNLIAKEYLASRTDDSGVLILSEMAGASSELGEAIIVNPSDVDEVAHAMESALAFSDEEQKRRNRVLRKRLKNYDIFRWGDDFIQHALAMKVEQRFFDTRFLDLSSRKQLVGNFAEAHEKLLMLDFDGTIAPISIYPSRVEPSEAFQKILTTMAKNIDTTIVIISGRTRKELDKWFDGTKVNLVAEHGAWIRETNDIWRMPVPITGEWKSQVVTAMRTFVDRLPGSSLEEKEFTVVWHYRAANPELSSLRAKELTDELTSLISNTDLQVLIGNKTVEVRSSKVSKGTAAQHWISKRPYDFILSIGDDRTDEDIFKILPENANSIKVGIAVSRAKFYLRNQPEVLRLFEQLQAGETIPVMPPTTR